MNTYLKKFRKFYILCNPYKRSVCHTHHSNPSRKPFSWSSCSSIFHLNFVREHSLAAPAISHECQTTATELGRAKTLRFASLPGNAKLPVRSSSWALLRFGASDVSTVAFRCSSDACRVWPKLAITCGDRYSARTIGVQLVRWATPSGTMLRVITGLLQFLP